MAVSIWRKMFVSEPDRMRILLVGASGRVGRMVLSHSHQSPRVAQIVPQYRESSNPGSLTWDPLLGPQPLLDSVAQGKGFDTMVMLAGVTPGPGKRLELNRALAQSSLNAAQNAGIRRVLLASSSAVYGPGDGTPFSEEVPCNPANDYGIAKMDMEQACKPWRDRGIDVCCLRIGNVAGADALLQNVGNAVPGQSIEIDIFADGLGPLRSYIGPGTMASVLHELCLHSGPLPPVLNVAAPTPIQMEELADAAGQAWIGRDNTRQQYQNITLNCDALSKIYAFEAHDSTPASMVEQWKDTLNNDA